MNIKDIKLPPIHLMLKRFFARFHVVTFVVIVLGGLAATNYFLNQVIASSAEVSDTSSTTSEPGFDTGTIERVNNLSESSGAIETLRFPSGQRTNPFTE